MFLALEVGTDRGGHESSEVTESAWKMHRGQQRGPALSKTRVKHRELLVEQHSECLEVLHPLFCLCRHSHVYSAAHLSLESFLSVFSLRRRHGRPILEEPTISSRLSWVRKEVIEYQH